MNPNGLLSWRSHDNGQVVHARIIHVAVTVADAVHLSAQLGEHHEAEEQIAFADVVLLNKIDLVDDKDLENVQTRIRKINPYAKIIKTNHCSAPLNEVLDLNAFSFSDNSARC